MQHVTTFLESFDDGVTTTVTLLRWAVSVYGSNARLIVTLSIVPVVSRWAFVLLGGQLSGTLWTVIDAVVGLFRVALVIVVLVIALETTPGGSGPAEGTVSGWSPLLWQVLLLCVVFLTFNVSVILLTSEAVVGRLLTVGGLSGDPDTVGSLVSFTVKNLVTIPLFVVCLCGFVAELLGS